MRILLDTNVILDIFLDREPFVDDAGLIWKAHEAERLTAYVSAITPVNLFYIARKLQGREIAARAVHRLLATLPVTTVNHSVLESALVLGFEDFEDAVQHASAETQGLAAIVSRNIEDFARARLDVLAPGDFIGKYQEIFENLVLD